MPNKKEILYPVFLKCCKYTNDGFWKYIFEDLAYGKSPYGSFINKGFICCNYKGKEFSYKIEGKSDSKTLYNDLYNLFTKKLNVLSEIDRESLRSDFEKEENVIFSKNVNWGTIKKKSVKDTIIQEYVVDMKSMHRLSISQARKLLSLVFIGLMFKTILTGDICYSNGKITDIKCIEFKNDEIIFNGLVGNSLSNSIDIIQENSSKKLSDNWDKYLQQIQKHVG